MFADLSRLDWDVLSSTSDKRNKFPWKSNESASSAREKPINVIQSDIPGTKLIVLPGFSKSDSASTRSRPGFHFETIAYDVTPDIQRSQQWRRSYSERAGWFICFEEMQIGGKCYSHWAWREPRRGEGLSRSLLLSRRSFLAIWMGKCRKRIFGEKSTLANGFSLNK